MRNAAVILFTLCICITCVLSLPTALEDTTKNEKSNLTTSVLRAMLPDNRKNIDENALYEHATNKENNLNERAFVFINQKYRKHSGKSYPNVNDFDSVPSYAHLQSFESNNQNNSELPNFVPRNVLNTNKEKNLKVHEYKTYSNALDEQLALLKPPIVSSNNKKNNIEVTNGSSAMHSKGIFKKYQLKNQYSGPKEFIDARESKNGKHFGFIHQLQQNLKRKESVVQDTNVEDDLLSDDSHFFDNLDEEKTLDQYLKDSSREQIATRNNRVNQKENEKCSFNDCVLETTSRVTPNIMNSPECNCAGKLNLKGSLVITRDRVERQDNDRNVPSGSLLLASPTSPYNF